MHKFDVEQITQWLAEHVPHVEMLEYGGKVISKSSFRNKNTGHTFSTSLNKIKNKYREGIPYLVGFTEQEIIAHTSDVRAKHSLEKRIEIQEKRKNTCIKTYGDLATKVPSVKDKIKQTNIERYGVSNPSVLQEIQDKIKDTNTRKYGMHSAKVPEIKIKKQQTNIERYGANTYNESIAAKYDGQTVAEISEKTGMQKSSVWKQLKCGISASSIKSTRTSIENVIARILDTHNFRYVQNKKLATTKYRPDFLIPDKKLIIECDGLYWHSDAVSTYKYSHRERSDIYSEKGYKTLFFREDEIHSKSNIVSSIILDTLNVDEIQLIPNFSIRKVADCVASDFLFNNHLLGAGSGRSYGLYTKDTLVAILQVDGNTGFIEISRFCTLQNKTINSCLQELLKFVVIVEQVKKLFYIVDLRFDKITADLLTAGFIKTNSTISFVWTKNSVVVPKTAFIKDTGYAHGFSKIWNYGEETWEFTV